MMPAPRIDPGIDEINQRLFVSYNARKGKKFVRLWDYGRKRALQLIKSGIKRLIPACWLHPCFLRQG